MLKQRFAGVRKSCRSEEVFHLGRMTMRDSAQGRGIRAAKKPAWLCKMSKGDTQPEFLRMGSAL